MLKKGYIGDLVTKREAEFEDGTLRGSHRASEALKNDFDGAFQSGSLKPSDVSFKHLFNELVDPDGYYRECNDVEKTAEAIKIKSQDNKLLSIGRYFPDKDIIKMNIVFA